MLQTSERAIQLRDPACNFETKCDWLGDDAMGSAGHQSSAMPDGQLRRGFADGGEVVADETRRLHHLDSHGRVVEVLAGHAKVHVPRFRLPDRFVEHRQEGDHVMADT